MAATPGYSPLAGSERPRPASHRYAGAADPTELIVVTLVVRPRPGSPPLPDLAYWQATPPGKHRFLSPDEYARTHGAAQADLDTVASFAAAHGVTVLASHAGRRTAEVRGTVAQMNAAFGIALNRYEAPLPPSAPRARSSAATPGAPGPAGTYVHYGYDGLVHLPPELVGVVTAVIGLDNRILAVPAGGSGDPPGATYLAVPAAAQLYNFPNTGAKNQRIGIIAPQGLPGNGASYRREDIRNYFSNLSDPNYRTPPVFSNDIEITVGNNTFANSPATVYEVTSSNWNTFPYSFIIELTQDICTAATIAQGVTIQVYFTGGDEQGWQAVLSRMLQPELDETPPTVVSCSFLAYPGDDSIGSVTETGTFGYNMTEKFQQLAALGINVFCAVGDWGADDWYRLRDNPAAPPDGSSRVGYPGSDPWVTACGGTILSENPHPPPRFQERVWSDAWSTSSDFGDPHSNFGATGGGVSKAFDRPPYQTAAGISGVADSAGQLHQGRGVPDVAGMVAYSGSDGSPYDWFYVNGLQYNFTGTSCVAPLYAGLAAVLRASQGVRWPGFLNPMLYKARCVVCNDVTVGNNDSVDTPANVQTIIHGYNTPDAPYFSAGAGWDACTGLGSLNGTRLLMALRYPIVTTMICTMLRLAPPWLSETLRGAGKRTPRWLRSAMAKIGLPIH